MVTRMAYPDYARLGQEARRRRRDVIRFLLSHDRSEDDSGRG